MDPIAVPQWKPSKKCGDPHHRACRRESHGLPEPLRGDDPSGLRGMGGMYPVDALFGEPRRGFEESRFWFQDGLYASEPLLSLRLVRSSRARWSL